MLTRVAEYIDKYGMLSACDTVVVGFSGGADSVCLLYMLSAISRERGFDIVAVHINHGIRGKEAERDADFCAKFAHKLGIEFRLFELDVLAYADEQRISSEEAGRALRYEKFNEVASEFKSARIAVAHHMNDRAETVIFNMCRGSGVRGMRGIVPVNGNIIRPLLCLSRDDIIEYVNLNKLSFCSDSTNFEDDYSRNKIRHNVLPYLNENINSAATRNIARMAEKMSEAEEYISKVVESRYDVVAEQFGDKIKLIGLENEDAYIARRIILKAVGQLMGLKDVGEQHIERVYGLLSLQSGVIVPIINGLSAQRFTEGIIIYYPEISSENIIYDVNVPGEIILPEGKVIFNLSQYDDTVEISKDDYTKCFDYDKIINGLQIRTRQPEDYIVIDSEGHTKSINRYLIDLKVPAMDRDRRRMLADGSHIIWVFGGRISEAVKIDNNTTRVLTVNYERTEDAESRSVD